MIEMSRLMEKSRLSSKAVQKLLMGVEEPNDLFRRNHAAFTLALILRDEGWEKEKVLDFLKWWNKKNAKPFKKGKYFKRITEYLFSEEGKKEKASWHWVELLSGEKVEDEFKPLFSELKPGELKKSLGS